MLTGVAAIVRGNGGSRLDAGAEGGRYCVAGVDGFRCEVPTGDSTPRTPAIQ
jgi:hypothetical protein